MVIGWERMMGLVSLKVRLSWMVRVSWTLVVKEGVEVKWKVMVTGRVKWKVMLRAVKARYRSWIAGTGLGRVRHHLHLQSHEP